MPTWRAVQTVPWLVLLLATLLQAGDLPDADTIIRRMEDNINGRTAVLHISMEVTTRHTTRTMRMESYSIGASKSFIRILYPGKDRGITFLKLDDQMWQYVPRIEKIIKIPASMMLQSWMGSDFTNDDLVRESSLSDDYSKKVFSTGPGTVEIGLIPKEEAAVVWGRIVLEVDTARYLPIRASYYDEDGILVRELHYREVRILDDRPYPTLWVMEPRLPERAGRRTVLRIDDAVFDRELKHDYFTRRALKRYSR